MPEVPGSPAWRIELRDLPSQCAGLLSERGDEGVDVACVLDVPEQMPAP